MDDKLDLDALERLEQAATPGPWTREKPGKNADGWSLGLAVAATYGRQTIYANPPGGSFPSADANLIVALRNAAPALIAAVRERDTPRAALRSVEARVWREAATRSWSVPELADVFRERAEKIERGGG